MSIWDDDVIDKFQIDFKTNSKRDLWFRFTRWYGLPCPGKSLAA